MPAAREARVERQRTVDDRHYAVDILLGEREDKSSVGEDASIVRTSFQRPSGKFDGFPLVLLRGGTPAIVAEPLAADRGPRESRAVTRIARDRFFKQLQRFDYSLTGKTVVDLYRP